MAIDSKQKRYAILNFGGDADILPPADGSFDKTDRLMQLGLYVYADSATPVVGNPSMRRWQGTPYMRSGARTTARTW